ncbi:MAG: DMT family transporter [Loktanella sp.]|nr:DMT family transporter [Loktanella sp.]
MSNSFQASAVVLLTGIFWGVYWVPIRTLAELGLDGAWGTGAITLSAVIFLLPFIIADQSLLRGHNVLAIASIMLGGVAFALYSIGFLYGKVALVILLWFFSPVWSVLIAKYLLRLQVPRLRFVAIAIGLTGLFIMLGSDGGLPIPRNLGEWIAFIAGIMWAFATAGMRLKSKVKPLPAALLFALGATMTSLLVAPLLEPVPTIEADDVYAIAVAVLLTSGLWWVISIAALMWATVRLDPARVGILLMTEVVFGAATAAVFAGESLSVAEIIGGFMVVICGILEVWPTRAGSRYSAALERW